jgi:hypothetical protein
MRANLGLVLLAAALAGCGSSPPSTFYALAPTQGSAQPSTYHTVKVRRLGIPGYLDRPEVVRRIVDFKLGVADTERWGEPFDEMVGRVLAEDLQQRAPGTSVFAEGGAITADPDATVEVDLRRFDVDANGEVTLVAQVAVEKGTAHVGAATKSVTLKGKPNNAGTSALVETMSDLLGQLADQIAPLLRGG